MDINQDSRGKLLSGRLVLTELGAISRQAIAVPGHASVMGDNAGEERKGAAKTVRLPVSAPSRCSLLWGATVRFVESPVKIKFRNFSAILILSYMAWIILLSRTKL